MWPWPHTGHILGTAKIFKVSLLLFESDKILTLQEARRRGVHGWNIWPLFGIWVTHMSAFMQTAWLIWYVQIRAAHARDDISTLQREATHENGCVTNGRLRLCFYRWSITANSRVMGIQLTSTASSHDTESLRTKHPLLNHYVWFISPHISFGWQISSEHVCSDGSPPRKMLARLGRQLGESLHVCFAIPVSCLHSSLLL